MAFTRRSTERFPFGNVVACTSLNSYSLKALYRKFLHLEKCNVSDRLIRLIRVLIHEETDPVPLHFENDKHNDASLLKAQKL